MKAPLGWEQAEQAAMRLMEAAFMVSSAYQVVRDLCETAPDAIRAEMSALDTLDDHAGNVAVALREIAMRLDRAALVKFDYERGGA